jgi:hypothetical protein
MESIAQAYRSAWEGIVKPERLHYDDSHVGPEIISRPDGELLQRHRLQVANASG